MQTTSWPFIVMNDRDQPVLEGTGTKVIDIAMDHLAYRWDADQIHMQHPTLSLPQIHAALGYYYEYQPECDQQIQDAGERIEALRTLLENPALQARLRRLKAAQ